MNSGSVMKTYTGLPVTTVEDRTEVATDDTSADVAATEVVAEYEAVEIDIDVNGESDTAEYGKEATVLEISETVKLLALVGFGWWW